MNRFQRRASAPFLKVNSGEIEHPLRYIGSITPHQYTEDPTVAWEMLKVKRPVKLVRQMRLDSPIKNDHVRFVCIACLHGSLLNPMTIPPGDVLVIAGDITNYGFPDEIKAFNENMAKLRYPFKVAIAGNHDCTFDEAYLKSSGKDIGEKELALKKKLVAALAQSKITNPKSLLTEVIYLQDSLIEIFGIRIYGTPWQPRYDNLAFNISRGQQILDKWNQIPAGIDVLITHTPPLGHGDMLPSGIRVGCVELLNSCVRRIRPKYHIFGHVHQGYGCTSDGYTKFVNCSYQNANGTKNSPIIFDMPIGADMKSQFMNNYLKLMKKRSSPKV
ncbi:unnamed protein product [Dracunculus medinensis]|uniref:Metallophos domain-containing protein n=1 Tax=Dracunculus medinensis TaxID=318479 RepID=A0A158Q2W9_DRAME|nr:unnamed protein product [Dracunculus medinensis]